MFKKIAAISLLISSTSTQPCDYDRLEFNAYNDENCSDFDAEFTQLVKELQEEHRDKQTGLCEYLGDDKGLSYTSNCNKWGWTREYFNGNDGCQPESLNTTQAYQWNVCDGPDSLGKYYLPVTTQRLLNDAKTLAAASVMALTVSQML